MELKIVCHCGQKYKFDVEPRNGRMPNAVACPVCGADGTEMANNSLAEQIPTPPIPVAMRVQPPAVSARVVARVAAPAADGEGAAAPVVLEGAGICKFHPGNPAAWYCNSCKRTLCEMCANPTELEGRMARICRGCGGEVVAARFRQAPPKSFYARVPGAFAYPFKGAGIIILVFATIGFSAVNFISGGIFGIFFRVLLYGFVFLFMQNIILTTTNNEKEDLGFPEASGLVGAAGQLAGTVLASFWLAIGLVIMKFNGVDMPSEAIMAAVILGGIYFPMALLVVAMKDTVVAANPLVVIPAMAKAPGQYAAAAILILLVFGVRQLGSILSGGAGTVSLRTHNMNVFLMAVAIQAVWALLSVYLLTVTMRILGVFYNTNKQKLGWFND